MKPNKVSHCSLISLNRNRIGDNSCISKQYYDLINSKANIKCESDECLLKEGQRVAPEETKREKQIIQKIRGPNNTQLLNNVNIDLTLRQWEMAKENYFFAYNFNMSDYYERSLRNFTVSSMPDTLETIKFSQLYYADQPIDRAGEIIKGTSYKCAGCIINTDVYSGGGKHWMALFLDWRNTDKWTVEFFNSSGNAPKSPWVRFMTRMVREMREVISKERLTTHADYVVASRKQLQKSKTECGVYSLYYIWCRFLGTPYTELNNIKDREMFEFRQHLFDGENNYVGTKFDWEHYKKTNNVKWEDNATHDDKN